MNKLFICFLILTQFLIINNVNAAKTESFSVLGIKYREPDLKKYEEQSRFIVGSTLENILMRDAASKKIVFKDISMRMQELNTLQKEIPLEEKNIPLFLNELNSYNVDYYIVGYVNSIGLKSGMTSVVTPVACGYDDAKTVQVDISIKIYSNKTKKMVFVATGRGESDRHAVNVGLIYGNVAAGGKFAFEHQLHNALQKAATIAAKKIAVAI